MGSPEVAVWMNPSGTGDSVAPGGAELVVVGGMHDKKVGTVVLTKVVTTLWSLSKCLCALGPWLVWFLYWARGSTRWSTACVILTTNASWACVDSKWGY